MFQHLPRSASLLQPTSLWSILTSSIFSKPLFFRCPNTNNTTTTTTTNANVVPDLLPHSPRSPPPLSPSPPNTDSPHSSPPQSPLSPLHFEHDSDSDLESPIPWELPAASWNVVNHSHGNGIWIPNLSALSIKQDNSVASASSSVETLIEESLGTCPNPHTIIATGEFLGADFVG